MKRYLVFAGDNYYPCGGIDDLIAEFDDLNDAVERGEQGYGRADGTFRPYDWWHILDTESGQRVYP